MWQKSVLLAFVEAVHFVHKHNGSPPLPAQHLGLLHRLANVFNAAQHSADGDDLGVKSIGHPAGNGGFAGTRWSPKNAAVRLARLEGDAQCHALAQQMLLAYDLAQRLGTKALGQGLVQREG